MDKLACSESLLRSSSQHSSNSTKSTRSQTLRARSRKHNYIVSSSASSLNTSASTSDKSLTSFPSFSPEPPVINTAARAEISGEKDYLTGSKTTLSYISSTDDKLANTSFKNARNALFDDAPILSKNIVGTIHNLKTEHIEDLIARNGAVALVRQISEDLAERDAQIAAIRRRADEKEQALRKIILECGLSNLDLETRLRDIEEGRRAAIEANSNQSSETGLEYLMVDAMNEGMKSENLSVNNIVDNNATIRAVDKLRKLDEKPRSISKGWKEFIWGGSSKKVGRINSLNRGAINPSEITDSRAGPTKGTRKSVLQNEIFKPPETKAIVRKQFVTDDIPHHERSASMGLTALALRLVAGKIDLDSDSSRGRSSSTGTFSVSRVPSTASMRTANSTRTIPFEPVSMDFQPEVKAKLRQQLKPVKSGKNANLRVPQDQGEMRSPCFKNITAGANLGPELSGPVEMDAILPIDDQPPTLNYTQNKQFDQEFLTDRYGFIYDNRRRKRYKEAVMMQISKQRGQVETLGRIQSKPSINHLDSEECSEAEEDLENEIPVTSVSFEGMNSNKKSTKRWQDYLSTSGSTTELLLHTPSRAASSPEFIKGMEIPRSSSGLSEGVFLPSTGNTASQPTLAVTSDNAIISKTIISTPPVIEEASTDTEPVKLLLKQLGDVHDLLQREKTIKWNDFLRKVRAERRRDGEAAASNATYSADPRSQRTIESMPETNLINGEMIGIAGLGNKGKVGRAKWNEFKALVLGGIPVAYRAKIWAECSGASALRIPGYYESLIAKSKVDDDPVITAQIEMDVNRTLTDNIFFRKGPGVSKLNEVLLAYSRRNAEVGYCQGMNLITACLLLIMPTSEDAFWFLTSIIENILPQGYYNYSLMSSRADQKVLRQYVTEILPKLSNHLEKLSVDLEALTFQWFLSVFTDCLSAEALFRVWDVVFCTNDGSTFLFQVALALLKLNEKQLLKCDTPAGVYTYINHQMTNHAISVDGLIKASDGLRKVVKREVVERRRARAIEADQVITRQREEISALKMVEKLAAIQDTESKSKISKNDQHNLGQACNKTIILNSKLAGK
ncbi:putative tbc domain-containing protein [Golovinomyces cichoracearum]|uniref:Putative tbc domain-containing protein n=1 Tax=Golovinomyces cichoracearum TaxID=62708 RepID=A0A420GIT1_9PEZI|nr:putative tbc domain-containing protein [Golovinomyces cichoracearum]